jgi:DNA repair protein RadC
MPQALLQTIPYQQNTHSDKKTYLGLSDDYILNCAKSIMENQFKRSHYLTSPNLTRSYLSLLLANKPRECFGVIFLDNQHGVLSFEILFEGTIDGASVYPREVVKAVLAHNAATVILVHNHPSGCTDPSSADKAITERIVSALKLIDVRVLDHLIVGGTDVTSFAERGLL